VDRSDNARAFPGAFLLGNKNIKLNLAGEGGGATELPKTLCVMGSEGKGTSALVSNRINHRSKDIYLSQKKRQKFTGAPLGRQVGGGEVRARPEGGLIQSRERKGKRDTKERVFLSERRARG